MRILILLFCAIPCFANELPDMPVAKAATAAHAHNFWSTPAKVELAGEIAAAGVDSAVTCASIDTTHTFTLTQYNAQFKWTTTTIRTHGREVWLPIHSCGGMVAFQIGEHAAAQGVAWVLHRTGHHKMEYLPRLYLIGENVAGVRYSLGHR